MAKHNCRYVLIPGFMPGGPKYCEKPVSFTLAEDDDGNRVRRYKSFCADCQAKMQAEAGDDNF